jgi:hypothetical protein
MQARIQPSFLPSSYNNDGNMMLNAAMLKAYQMQMMCSEKAVGGDLTGRLSSGLQGCPDSPRPSNRRLASSIREHVEMVQWRI